MPRRVAARQPFWRRKRLDELSLDEWESICDGCGKCCLHKLEDVDSGEVEFTDIACRLLDPATGRCRDYLNRTLLVPDCVELLPRSLGTIRWLPTSCAYRLLHESGDLPVWHPLVSGDADSVRKAGLSVCGRVVSEDETTDLEAHVVTWPE